MHRISRIAVPFLSLILSILGAGAIFLPTSGVAAQSILAFESPLAAKEAQKQITEILDKLDKDSYELEPETLGFTFRAVNLLRSPFSYSIYGGPISRKIPTTVIRLEGGTGDVRMFTRILEQKNIIKTNQAPRDDEKPTALSPKNHYIAQGLNFLAPWAGVLYGSWNSPRLSGGQTFWRVAGYFILDFLAIYGGGSNWFRESFDGAKWNSSIIASVLAVRALGAYQNANLIRGHNRVAELKFTFYLE